MAWWLQEMVEDWMFSEGRKRERERERTRGTQNNNKIYLEGAIVNCKYESLL
jgi:hypothetical protein